MATYEKTGTFTQVTENGDTNVLYPRTKAEIVEGLGYFGPVTTEGDGAAYIATVPGIDELKVGIKLTIVPHTVSTTLTPTLNVNNLGAEYIRMSGTYNTATCANATIETWITEGKPITLQWDGEQWKTVDINRPNAQSLAGVVPIENGGTGASTAAEGIGKDILYADYLKLSKADRERGNYYIEDIDAVASMVEYDNSTSGLEATDVQGAIDEINSNLSASSVRYNEETDSLDVYMNGEVIGSLPCNFQSFAVLKDGVLYGTEFLKKFVESKSSIEIVNGCINYSVTGTTDYNGNACLKAIDVTKYKILRVTVTGTLEFYFGLYNTPITQWGVAPTVRGAIKDGIYDIDISTCTGNMYVGLWVHGAGGTGSGKITEIMLI